MRQPGRGGVRFAAFRKQAPATCCCAESTERSRIDSNNGEPANRSASRF